jgi:4-hydroxy-3-methylbut-2-enyl diphosphate reductase
MKINVAKSAGFCFGVKRALEIALETSHSEKNVCMLGDIVHNEDVVRQIQRSGIKKIKRLGKGFGKTLLIRAHGASLATINKAKKLGFKITDATCPMVKEIHSIAANMERKGYTIIIIGDKKHDEVQGILGQLKNKAIVIDSLDSLPFNALKGIKKASVVVQSTQNLDKTLSIVSLLKKYIKDLRFFNTICRPTRIKQEEIKALPLKNEVMIIIGSKTSANTKRLYQISKALNKHSFWIQSGKDIKAGWFRGIQKVGITAGASTPDSTTQAVVKRIQHLP